MYFQRLQGLVHTWRCKRSCRHGNSGLKSSIGSQILANFRHTQMPRVQYQSHSRSSGHHEEEEQA